MKIKALAHVCIKTTDLAATSDFYCGALGMKKQFNFLRGGKVIGFYIKAGNASFIEVFHADEVEKIGKEVLNHFCLETDDMEGLRQSLVARGYQPGEIKMGADSSYQFWMQDPNGMAMEFHQYTDASTQFSGKDVEVNW